MKTKNVVPDGSSLPGTFLHFTLRYAGSTKNSG